MPGASTASARVTLLCLGRCRQIREASWTLSIRRNEPKLCDLRLAHRIVIDFKDINLVLLVDPVLVDPDNVFAAVNARLLFSRGLFTLSFGRLVSIAFAMPPAASTSAINPGSSAMSL